MHSYQTLAILALAVSTASPAISAPVQEQARAIVDDRSLSDILKTIASGAVFGSAPLLIENLLGGNSTRRDLNGRAPLAIGSLFDDLLGALKTADPFKKVIGDGILSGVASGSAVIGTEHLLNSTRRAFSLSDLSGIEKTLAGLATSFAAAQGIQSIFGGNSTKREPQAPPSNPTTSDLLIALSLLGRQLEELD